MSDIMAQPEQLPLENKLREKRQALGFSQKQLAAMAGITRQAVCAVEANQYCPATSVALQLARALRCRVEELFSIRSGDEIIEGELCERRLPSGAANIRSQLIQIGDRLWVRPLDGCGELTGLSATADGLILAAPTRGKRVKVRLLKDRETLRRTIAVAGCDPAMFLASEYLAKGGKGTLVPCLMGSAMALRALAHGETHVAGIHLADERSGSWHLPALERAVKAMKCLVVTFAHWEEGFIVQRANPKSIHAAADLPRLAVRVVNRELGSGARRLLDRELKNSGIQPARVKGYRDEALSHLEVAARIKAGLADVGIGVRAAASICGLDFVMLQRERYDLVIPSFHYENLPGVQMLLDTIVSKSFRDEISALGYDTRETGKRVEMGQRQS
jgi:putative molybdopterin biosynthesis protein